jgi:hypothetical protein
MGPRRPRHRHATAAGTQNPGASARVTSSTHRSSRMTVSQSCREPADLRPMMRDRQHRHSRIVAVGRSVWSEETLSLSTARWSTGTMTVGHCAWLRQSRLTEPETSRASPTCS